MTNSNERGWQTMGNGPLMGSEKRVGQEFLTISDTPVTADSQVVSM